MKKIKFNFEDLKIYQKAIDFVDLVYKTSKNFPNNERFTLSSQFIKTSVSIALNIVEESENTNAQFNRFLQITLGSVKECVACSTIARKQNYINQIYKLKTNG